MFAYVVPLTHPVTVTNNCLSKGPSRMPLCRLMHPACCHEPVNPPNKALHKMLVHPTIAEGAEAEANAVRIAKISHAALGVATEAK